MYCLISYIKNIHAFHCMLQEPVHNKSSDGHGAGDYGDDFMQEEESFARSAAQIVSSCIRFKDFCTCVHA